MSTTRKKIEGFYNDVSAIVDKFGGRKADLNKTQKYSDTLVNEIRDKSETFARMGNAFIQADENFGKLSEADCKRGLASLLGIVEAAESYRNTIVGMNNDMARKALKLKAGDTEKYLKQFNSIEKDVAKFVEKNSKNFTLDDHIAIGFLAGYIKLAKDDLCAGAALVEVQKKFDNTMPILSNNACSNDVVNMNKMVNLMRMYYDALVKKFLPNSVYNPATLFEGKNAGSSSTGANINKKDTKLKA